MDSNPWGHDTVRNFDRQETRLVDYPSLGCRVRVHDTSGSKLDGRSKVGRWMGLDDETGDGHRIYWPEKRLVTVERSVKFNFADEVIVGTLPLEGEEPATVEQSIPPLRSETPIPDIVISEPDAIEPTEELGRGKRVRKESEYVRMLRDGTGITSARPSDSLLPKGLLTGSVNPLNQGENVSGVAVEDFAMATVMGGAEGIEPTYEEARKHPDWPKWEEAIQTELRNLKDSGTWKLVKQPEDATVGDCRWVLQIKKNDAGKIEKYKARLVAKGFTQIH